MHVRSICEVDTKLDDMGQYCNNPMQALIALAKGLAAVLTKAHTVAGAGAVRRFHRCGERPTLTERVEKYPV